MRKITEDSVRAFLRHEQFCRANMDCDGEMLKLHRNVIAEHHKDGIIISMCGWDSPTTRERLKGLLFHANTKLTIWTNRGTIYLGTWESYHREPAYLRGRVEINSSDRYLIDQNHFGIEAIILWRA